MNPIEFLFRQGLSSYPVLCRRDNAVYLGRIIFEKERIVFKDMGILNGEGKNINIDDYEKYIVGMVCFQRLQEWESLSFFGADYCKFSGELDEDLHTSLVSMKDRNRLYDFIGSLYRAFNMLMEEGHIPIVFLKSIKSKDDTFGLTIIDLRSLLDNKTDSLDAVYEAVNELLINAIEKRLTFDLNNMDAK